MSRTLSTYFDGEMMTTVHVRYRYEPEGWWAESEEIAGWTAAGSTFQEVRELARAGLLEFLGNNVLVEEDGIPLEMSAGVWRQTSSSMSVVSGGTFMFGATSIVPAARRSPAEGAVKPTVTQEGFANLAKTA